MSAAALSVGVALIWGIGASWDGWVAKQIDPWVAVAWRVVYGLVATTVLTIAGVHWWLLSATAWLWLALAGLFLAGGWLCYMHALRRDHNELSIALSATYVLPAVLILVILGQPVGWPILLACLLVACGSFIAKASVAHGTHGLTWSLGASLIWGFWALASWQAAKQAAPIDLIGGSAVIAIIIGFALTLAVYQQGKSMIIPKKVAAIKVAGWTANGLSTWMMFLAFDRGPAAQVMVISAAYPLVALVCGYFISKDGWSLQKLLAVILLCAGAALAAFARMV